MTKRPGAFAIAALLALAITSFHVSAYGQSADLVLCDRIAADPADPDKPADVKGTAEIAQSDVATAIKFCKVASASSRRALYELGRAYAANRQLPEAMSAWRKAADKGSTSAMVELGVMLGTGAGGAKDPAEARKLFERAAEAGNARGVTNLAALSGGAPSDPVKARALLSKAAQTDSAEAQYQLGLMTADGVGGPKDDVAARGLFEKAAAQNHPAALERMGAFAQSGRGGPRPYVIKDKNGKFVTSLCF
jgi:TPR repeat protein